MMLKFWAMRYKMQNIEYIYANIMGIYAEDILKPNIVLSLEITIVFMHDKVMLHFVVLNWCLFDSIQCLDLFLRLIIRLEAAIDSMRTISRK